MKAILIALAIYFILSKLSISEYEGIFAIPWYNSLLLIPVFFILWILNLWLDAMIWKTVNNFVAPISIFRALKTNFICYALAFITPANSGELAGRYIMLDQKGDRQKTIFLTFWSHFPRFITKFLLGGSSLLLLAFSAGKISSGTTAFALIIGIICFMIFYLSFLRIQNWIQQKGLKKFEISRYILDNRPFSHEKIQLLLLSVLKYLAYNFQFIILILMWANTGLTRELFLSVVVFYFITALIPTFAAADFLVKGALALYIFDAHIATEAQLVNASFVTWVFNIALPALAGTFIIFKTNLGHSFKMKFSRGNPYDRGD